MSISSLAVLILTFIPAVTVNDNRKPAATSTAHVLTLELRAGVGLWRPAGDAGPSLAIEAFGEAARNELTTPLRVHGLCERGGAACAPVDIPAGETRQTRFKSGPAGTYFYWATSTGMPLPFRGSSDTQLSGAFIVDPPGVTAPDDRVFVITEWTSLTRPQLHEL